MKITLLRSFLLTSAWICNQSGQWILTHPKVGKVTYKIMEERKYAGCLQHIMPFQEEIFEKGCEPCDHCSTEILYYRKFK
jgi:hypothetical protein